jgi:hypothetical protein
VLAANKGLAAVDELLGSHTLRRGGFIRSIGVYV